MAAELDADKVVTRDDVLNWAARWSDPQQWQNLWGWVDYWREIFRAAANGAGRGQADAANAALKRAEEYLRQRSVDYHKVRYWLQTNRFILFASLPPEGIAAPGWRLNPWRPSDDELFSYSQSVARLRDALAAETEPAGRAEGPGGLSIQPPSQWSGC